ncbi:hypothetical protein [Streptomyces sp. NPDC010273]|uniref:hypothetical protein n=1 Tax=Streptomyces sp. NPDC010273 TaxID=3364829 RepID=UPI0036E074B9
MALKLTSKSAVRLSWADASMEAIWVLRPEDSQEELVSKMKLIVNFIEDQEGAVLPKRTPGLALEMAQVAHPAPVALQANGWAVQPDIPERLQGQVEMIPEGERDE